jgi:hypothetical protein
MSEFFRPTDMFPIQNGVSLSHHPEGVSLSGTGFVLQPLQENLEGSFRLNIRIGRGGQFSVSPDTAFTSGFWVETGGNQLTLHANGQTASIPYPATAASPIDVTLEWDKQTGTVHLKSLTESRSILVPSPPSSFRYLGYGVDGSTAAFRQAELTLPEPGLSGAPLSVTPGETFLRLQYSRPPPPDGQRYILESSTDLITPQWIETTPWLERLETGFGNRQRVDVRVTRQAETAPVFYRITLP